MLSKEKPIKWSDQILHFGSCFVFTLFSLGFGAPIVILWAITREYYQRKRTMESVLKYQPSFGEVMEGFDFWKRDLVFSYGGIAAGLLIAIPFDIWIF